MGNIAVGRSFTWSPGVISPTAGAAPTRGTGASGGLSGVAAVNLSVVIVVLLSGCGGTDASSTKPQPVPDPVGVVAVGHSGLTAESSDPERPGQAARENSWATGTNPDVHSIYLRLVAARPETEGHVVNRAVGGASASQLADQVSLALDVVPLPALAIVQTIDNDIRCDGTDEQHVPEFGSAVSDALEVISKRSPNTRILIVGQPGRPSVAGIQAEVRIDPQLKAETTGTGPCDFYDPDGRVNEDHIADLRRIIEGYEAEQARVCALVPHCSTDDGVSASFSDDPRDRVQGHLNMSGQARIAELFWPAVAKLLP